MNTKHSRFLVALIVVLAPAFLPTGSRALSQEQKVRDHVVNDLFGFAVTIPPGRTATRVQHVASDAKTLFISVSLPKPVNIEIYAECDPQHDEELGVQIQRYISELRRLGGTEIVSSGPQPVSLGSLQGSKYQIHFSGPDGRASHVIWIGGKRKPQPHDRRVIVVSVTLGGDSLDVAEYESELNVVVQSFEWLDSPTQKPATFKEVDFRIGNVGLVSSRSSVLSQFGKP